MAVTKTDAVELSPDFLRYREAAFNAVEKFEEMLKDGGVKDWNNPKHVKDVLLNHYIESSMWTTVSSTFCGIVTWDLYADRPHIIWHEIKRYPTNVLMEPVLFNLKDGHLFLFKFVCGSAVSSQPICFSFEDKGWFVYEKFVHTDISQLRNHMAKVFAHDNVEVSQMLEFNLSGLVPVQFSPGLHLYQGRFDLILLINDIWNRLAPWGGKARSTRAYDNSRDSKRKIKSAILEPILDEAIEVMRSADLTMKAGLLCDKFLDERVGSSKAFRTEVEYNLRTLSYSPLTENVMEKCREMMRLYNKANGELQAIAF